jgi:hypothetical protein
MNKSALSAILFLAFTGTLAQAQTTVGGHIGFVLHFGLGF